MCGLKVVHLKISMHGTWDKTLSILTILFLHPSCLLSAAITACVMTEARVHCALSGSCAIKVLYDFGWFRAKEFMVVPCLSSGAFQNQNAFSANSTTKLWEHHTKLLSSRLIYRNSTSTEIPTKHRLTLGLRFITQPLVDDSSLSVWDDAQ